MQRARTNSLGRVALLCCVLLMPAPGASAASPPSAQRPTHCSAAPDGRDVDLGPGHTIHVRTVGSGQPILMIPSLGRGAGDFDEIAGLLARHGFMSILPDPRWIADSRGPEEADLFALADDSAAVAEALCDGPVDVVGHAFGNRVARAFAASRPAAVRRVALLAGGGEVPMPADVRASLAGSVAEGQVPDEKRLNDLRRVFFAKGNDPSVWLHGWFPQAATLQSKATQKTPVASWWRAGTARVLLVQAAEDPIAPPDNAAKLRQDIGKRLTLVNLPHASHAILPEQPKAVSAALSAYFKGGASEASLQRAIDEAIARP